MGGGGETCPVRQNSLLLKAVLVSVLKTVWWTKRKQGEKSALRSDRFTAGEKSPCYPLNRRLSGPSETVWTFWRKEKSNTESRLPCRWLHVRSLRFGVPPKRNILLAKYRTLKKNFNCNTYYA